MKMNAITFLVYTIGIISIILVRIVAIFIVAAALAAFLGLTGVLWLSATIVIFLVINAIISRL